MTDPTTTTPDRAGEPQTGETALREALGRWTPQHSSECASQRDEADCICGTSDVYEAALALAIAPDTRPASVAGLGAAWAEAEAALPEGCILVSRWDPGVYRAVWSGDGGLGRDHVDADSPAAALHALAQRLREHSDPGAAGEAGL